VETTRSLRAMGNPRSRNQQETARNYCSNPPNGLESGGDPSGGRQDVANPAVFAARCTARSSSVTCKSVRHTPQACTATRNSPGPGCGTSTVTRFSGWVVIGPGCRTRHALMLWAAILPWCSPCESYASAMSLSCGTFRLPRAERLHRPTRQRM
jgi:hypothetical protein